MAGSANSVPDAYDDQLSSSVETSDSSTSSSSESADFSISSSIAEDFRSDWEPTPTNHLSNDTMNITESTTITTERPPVTSGVKIVVNNQTLTVYQGNNSFVGQSDGEYVPLSTGITTTSSPTTDYTSTDNVSLDMTTEELSDYTATPSSNMPSLVLGNSTSIINGNQSSNISDEIVESYYAEQVDTYESESSSDLNSDSEEVHWNQNNIGYPAPDGLPLNETTVPPNTTLDDALFNMKTNSLNESVSNITGSNMTHEDIPSPDFHSANISGTNVSSTSFSSANVSNINVSSSNVGSEYYDSSNVSNSSNVSTANDSSSYVSETSFPNFAISSRNATNNNVSGSDFNITTNVNYNANVSSTNVTSYNYSSTNVSSANAFNVNVSNNNSDVYSANVSNSNASVSNITTNQYNNSVDQRGDDYHTSASYSYSYDDYYYYSSEYYEDGGYEDQNNRSSAFNSTDADNVIQNGTNVYSTDSDGVDSTTTENPQTSVVTDLIEDSTTPSQSQEATTAAQTTIMIYNDASDDPIPTTDNTQEITSKDDKNDKGSSDYQAYSSVLIDDGPLYGSLSYYTDDEGDYKDGDGAGYSSDYDGDDLCPPAAHVSGTPPKDCDDIAYTDGNGKISGEYCVYPMDGGGSIRVFCDMENDGGGWTVSTLDKAFYSLRTCRCP